MSHAITDLDTHLCAEPHDGCPLPEPVPADDDLDARLRQVMGEFRRLVAKEKV